MNGAGKLVLLLGMVVLVAASTCTATSFLLATHTPPPNEPNDLHHWLHAKLGITEAQDKALEQEETRFAAERNKLIAAIQTDNAQLATVMEQDREYSTRVKAAVEKINFDQSELQKATLQHIFAMKPILSTQQFDQLLKLTHEALSSPPDL